MEKEENPIYERNTLEFVTVALEYCTFVEAARNTGLFDFVERQQTFAIFIILKAKPVARSRNLKRKTET